MDITKNLSAAVVGVLAAGTAVWGIEPANPNATPNARKVLTYLYELPKQSENRLISGHLAGGSVGPNLKADGGFYKFTLEEIEYLHNVSGQWVGLIGADYCAGWLESPNPVEDTMYYKDLNQKLIAYWNAGGLVAITTHQFDPRELYKDGGQCFFKHLPKGAKRIDLSRVYTPGNEEYDNFRVIMDRWAEGLGELADHGVVVLWRPFNEARDGKWWCLQPTDQYKALFRYTFDYMTRAKGLNNLLWVFDPVRNSEDLAYYPGDDYVDIVGYTMNWDSGPAPNATRPLPGKVFGCIEFNVRADLKKTSPAATPRDYNYMTKLNWVKENLPYCSFFMSWNRVWGPYGRGTPESVRAMYNDPAVANRGELDWRRVGNPTKNRHPNVLLILSDDQGYGDLRINGNEKIDTPVLDRLAKQGARFDHFYVSPVCAPTRAALMTGRYFLRTGVVAVVPDYKATMRLEELTLGEVFKQAGYATGLFGKWHLGKWHPYLPNPQGFDEYVGFRSGATGNYFDATLEHNGQNLRTKGYITDALTDKAIEFIRRNRDVPFFCYVPYNVVHQPLQVPDRYLKKYLARGLDGNSAAVYGMVENMDQNVGRLLTQLDELGLVDDTIVLFLSDNGPGSGRRYNAGMRGGKGGVDEGGVRVPLFVRWPGHVAPDTQVAQLAADIDLLPTLVELCGIPMPQTLPLDGRSLAPLVLGRDAPWPARKIFSVRMNGDHNKPPRMLSGAVRTDLWRLVVRGDNASLYDVIADPGQQQDVGAQHADVVESLRAAYNAWYADVTAGGFERVPIPIGYAADPSVVLESPDAHLEGTVSVKGKVNWDIYWVHSWTSRRDHVWWDVEVVEAGRYAASITYQLPPEAAALPVCIEAAGSMLDGVLTAPAPTERRATGVERLGEISLPQGRYRLFFRVQETPDPGFRFNSIRLTKNK